MAAAPTVLRAAWLYYEDGLTQAEIAAQLSVSRATVGRLLDDARRTGIVTHQFHSDRLEALSLTQELHQAFGLQGALVVPAIAGSSDQKVTNTRVAKGAAQYLAGRMGPGNTLALGWGDTVARTISALQLLIAGELSLVTLTGGANAYLGALLGGDDERSHAVRVRASVVPAPIIASSPELAAALRAEDEVQQILSECAKATFAVVGVGTPTPGSTLTELGYVSAAELREIREKGAVGDILGQFYDADGQLLDLSILSRRIGIDVMELAAQTNVIGVAGGDLKVGAIMAAISGGYIDVLVTDEPTARAMLNKKRAPAKRKSS